MLWPWAAALALLLSLPALWRPAARPWVLALLSGWALCGGLWVLPALWPGSATRWNWPGALLATAAALGLAWLLQRRAGLDWAEMGLSWRQRQGSLGPALAVSAAVLLLHAGSLHGWSLDPARCAAPGLPPLTWLYQASLPGLAEELVFRGLGLALADRAFEPRRQLLGVRLGWGAVLVSVVFLALHASSAQALLAVLPAALLTLWLRVRTGSLLLPVLVHNAWNLLVVAAMQRACG